MAKLAELKAEHRHKVGDAPSSTDFEAEALLTCYASTNPAMWAREWAELHDRWGIPCFGFASWEEWAATVATSTDQRWPRSEAA